MYVRGNRGRCFTPGLETHDTAAIGRTTVLYLALLAMVASWYHGNLACAVPVHVLLIKYDTEHV